MAPKGAYAFEGVDAGLLHEVHKTFTGFLFGALGQNPRWSQALDIANDLPVRGNEGKAKFASRAYGVHEWVDERHKAKIEHADHTVEVKRWANAISLKVDDLEDEDLNLAQYRMLISEMADDFVEHRHTLFMDLLKEGFGTTLGTSFDGQPFFDDSHPIGLKNDSLGTQSNLIDLPFSTSALYTAIETMEVLRRPNGLSANLIPTHGIFPVALRSAVEEVLLSKEIDGSTNTLKDRIKPIFDPRLDSKSTVAWYVLDASKALKPFFTADRKPVTPQMSDKDVFEEGVAHWGAYGRYNASYGFYHTMVGSTGGA